MSGIPRIAELPSQDAPSSLRLLPSPSVTSYTMSSATKVPAAAGKADKVSKGRVFTPRPARSAEERLPKLYHGLTDQLDGGHFQNAIKTCKKSECGGSYPWGDVCQEVADYQKPKREAREKGLSGGRKGPVDQEDMPAYLAVVLVLGRSCADPYQFSISTPLPSPHSRPFSSSTSTQTTTPLPSSCSPTHPRPPRPSSLRGRTACTGSIGRRRRWSCSRV